MKQLDDGKELHDINIDLKLSKLKPLHAWWVVRWVVQPKNHSQCLETLEDNWSNESWKGLSSTQLANGCSYKNEDSDESSSESESEYVTADDFERNVFGAILEDEDDEL